MTVVFHSRSNNYSIRSFPNVVHDSECFFYNEKDSEHGISITKSGINKNENNEYIYHLNHHDYRNIQVNSSNNMPTSNETRSQPGISQRYSTVFALAKNILTMSWNNCIKYNKDYPSPSLKEIHNQIVNYTIKRIKIKKNPLSKLFYNGVKEGAVFKIEQSLDNKYFAFTLLPLFDTGIQLKGDEYYLNLRNPGSTETRICRVKKEVFESALKSIRNLPGPYYAGGFLSKPDLKPPLFQSFVLIPISDYGAPIESSYERSLFNELAKENRKVQRPSESYYVSWNGFIPDGVLIDTTPHTIIEVYGMSENKEHYHLIKEKKRMVFSKIEQFRYWEWEAYKSISIPLLPI